MDGCTRSNYMGGAKVKSISFVTDIRNLKLYHKHAANWTSNERDLHNESTDERGEGT
jgi:hypothetical protein